MTTGLVSDRYLLSQTKRELVRRIRAVEEMYKGQAKKIGALRFANENVEFIKRELEVTRAKLKLYTDAIEERNAAVSALRDMRDEKDTLWAILRRMVGR